MNKKLPNIQWADEDLVVLCKAGDQKAWDALVEKYSRLIYSVPVRYKLPPEEAADVFQSVWFDLYQDLPNLQKAGAIRSWLLTATSRKCLLHKQRRLKLAGTGDDVEVVDQTPDPLSVQEEVERLHLLNLAINRIPDRCQTLVRILFFEQPPVSYAEAAKRLGLAEGSIGFIRGRCLEKLRKQLRELGIES